MKYQDWINTEITNAGRVLSKGKITDLSAEFHLPNFIPFSIFLVPLGTPSNLIQVVNVTLDEDKEDGYNSPCPFNLGCWTEPLIKVISSGQSSLLSTYDIYWGCGQSIEQKY